MEIHITLICEGVDSLKLLLSTVHHYSSGLVLRINESNFFMLTRPVLYGKKYQVP